MVRRWAWFILTLPLTATLAADLPVDWRRAEILSEITKSLPERYLQMLESFELSRSLRGSGLEGDLREPRNELLQVLRDHPRFESLPELQERLRCLNGAGTSLSELIEVARHVEKWAINELGSIDCQAPAEGMAEKTQLSEVQNRLWSQPSLRPNHPSHVCQARALLISKALDEMKIPSQQLHLVGPFATVQRLNGGGLLKAYSYHVANIIKVREGNATRTYVIDPAHTSRPTPIDEYLKAFVPRPRLQETLPQSEFIAHFKRRNSPAEKCAYSNYALAMAEQIVTDERRQEDDGVKEWQKEILTESQALRRLDQLKADDRSSSELRE